MTDVMNDVATASATFQPGTWYTGKATVKEMAEWCVTNSKPFFMYFTNLKGGCSYCEEWDEAAVNTASFKTYVQKSQMYFGVCDGAGNDMVQQKIKELCGGDVKYYPYGMFYADSTFNEYFQRPETNKTCSNCKSVSWIRNAAELSALCKTYEDYKKVVITYYVVMFVDWDGTVLKTQKVEQGKSATPPNDPVRQYYIFTGWDKSYSNVQQSVTITAQYRVDDSKKIRKKLIESRLLGIGHDVQLHMRDDVICYYISSLNAILPKLQYTITFMKNASGATGVMQSMTYKAGQRWTCPACAYAYQDYTFMKFARNADGSGQQYIPGQSYDSTFGDITMYAVWEMKKTHDTYVVLAATETSPGCAKLNGMHKDADRIKSLLPSDIPDSNIIVLKNSDCTTENLKKHLEIGKDYKLLVYLFSDHGSSKNNGDMCTYNGRFNSADFYKIVSQAKGRVFAIFACCYAQMQYKSASPYEHSDIEQAGNADDTSFDWAQGAIDYFNRLKQKQDEIRRRHESYEKDGIIPMSSSASAEDAELMSLNAEPDMLCWCACKNDQVSYMKSGVGHHLITGFVNTFNAKSSYKTAWSAFANSSPAKGSATTPVKAVLGTSFENNTIFT